MFQKMKEILELSGPPHALSALQCSVAAGAPQDKWAVFHGKGRMDSPPRVNPEVLESPNGCKAAGSKTMGWEWEERPGPPCPYSVMPGTEQPCRAACLAASGLDHSCAGSSVCAVNSALIQLLQLCPEGSFWRPVRRWICAARQLRVGW